jgi:transposase-like protein
MAAMNKVQFQAGMSLSLFLHRYGDEAKCENAVERQRWPKGYVCSGCRHHRHYVVWHGRVKTFQCCACRSQVTLTSGTIFHGSKLPLTKWFQAMYFLTQSKNNVSALELKRLIGVCYRSAWRVKHKLLEVMVGAESNRVLEGTVEVDDAYLGGANKGGKRGRGSENKVPFIAALQLDEFGRPKRAIFSRVRTFSHEEVGKWARRHIATDSIVVSDGLECFSAIKKEGAGHMPITVGAKRKSTDMPCFKWINTIIGNLETATSGTYHAFDFEKYGALYLAEAQYRFNRRFDLGAILQALLGDAIRTAKRTEVSLRQAEGRR